MSILLWFTIGFIIIGFAVLISMKRGMERKVDLIKANKEDEKNSPRAKPIIWWIWSTTAWGIASMFLVVWCFHNYLG